MNNSTWAQGEATSEAGPLALVVSFDGLRADALERLDTPGFGRLVSQGAFSLAATVDYPLTLPSFLSIFSGLTHRTHGVTWDEYRPEAGVFSTPTIFGAAASRGLKTALFAGKEKFRHFDLPGTISRLVVREETTNERNAQLGNDVRLTRQAMEALDNLPVGLMALHIAFLDWFGHVFKWMSAEYLEAVCEADTLVECILARLEFLESRGRKVFLVVTSDHGGHDRFHGDSGRPEDCLVPWIVRMPGVISSGHRITTSVRNLDTAAAVLDYLGIPYPSGFEARHIGEIWMCER